MAATVRVDADDLPYLAELARRHLVDLGSPDLLGNDVAWHPIFRAFLTLEDQAPHTFAHQYALWGGQDETGDEGGG